MLQIQPPRRVRAELSVRVGRIRRTLEVAVTPQSLHTDPGEHSLYSTNDGLSDRISKYDRPGPLSEPCAPREGTEPKTLGSGIVGGERTV